MGSVFLRHGDTFVPMREQKYEAERLLQELIAEHPEVLAEDETGERSAWVLVKDEPPIPDSDEGPGRWSADLLFLDQGGVPTVVEVKRSSDTRARREVVAQMIEYAANATAYWKVELLREWFEAECERKSVDPQVRLNTAFDVTDSEGYWQTVRTNLAAKRIRLVFVADEIGLELRSMIEFLNGQMADIEVFAIEVTQYVDAEGERQTFVPRTLGRTAAARAAKSGGMSRHWERESLLDEIDRLHGSEVKKIAEELVNWAESEDRPDVRPKWGTGGDGSASIKLHGGKAVLFTAFSVWTSGVVQISFSVMQAPFAESHDAREELRRRINEAVPEANLPPEGEKPGAPYFNLSALSDEKARQGFLAAIEWAFDQARPAQGEEPSPTA